MASLKAIRRRIASVKSTQQITRAMKLVAAARLRRAQESLLNFRPYHEALSRVADSVLRTAPQAFEPAERAQNKALLVSVGSDRGLCGSYNINLLRHTEETAARLGEAGVETVLFAVGRKALDHFRRGGRALAGQRINNQPRLATFALARDLAAELLRAYRAGEVREAGVVYSQFKSAVAQRPVYQRLLPLAEPKPEQAGAAAAPGEYLVEPSRAELLPLLLRSYLEDALFHALLEGEASEQGARMVAMDNATNNAADMIGRLTLEMNRARQDQITKELMDIVGGAEALRA